MRSITIVGGGVVGTSLAYQLRDSAFEVTLLEKRSLGAGTTSKSIACFGWYPLYSGHDRDLAVRSWDIYEPFVEDGSISYHQNGLLETAETEATFRQLKESVKALDAAGTPAEVLDPEDVEAFGVNPAVASAGATFYPTAGRLDPAEIVARFAELAREAGVTIETGVEVTDIRTDDAESITIETSDGPLETDVLVNAAGPWAHQIDAMVGLTFPLRHTYAPIIVLETTENFELPTVLLEDGRYFTGERSAKVLAGDAPHDSADEDRWEAALELDAPETKEGLGIGSVSESHRQTVALEGPDIVPALEGAEISNEWRGIRCLAPDYRPIVGPTDVDGYYVATGMSGWGITYGPACGELLADHLETGSMPDELSYLSPDRF